ncbi:MAG: hypothetical protein ACE5HJ_00055 [Thermoplasmata archaeon]
MGSVYVVIAAAALGGVIGLTAYFAQSHERMKRGSPAETKAEYLRAIKLSILIAVAGAAILGAGFMRGITLLLWVGGVALSVGVMILTYNALGHLDTSGRARETLHERILGTLLVVFGLLTFLSWGLDFIAFPSAGITLFLAGLWVFRRVRRPPRR